jgi:hypothetical protein
MKWRRICLAASLSVLAAVSLVQPALAAKGTPYSPDFGYGARLDISGKYIPEALQSAATQKIDWISIDFDWAALWPDSGREPDLTAVDAAMDTAQRNGLAVMLSLSDAPAWAQTKSGPNAKLTAWLVLNLAQRYPKALQAVELFPGANLATAWGAAPNPAAYCALFQAAQYSIQQARLPLLLVAGGLTPLANQPASGDVDDLQYLQGMYQSGAAASMAIISLRFQDLTGEPLQAPDGQEHRVLRHYEEVRQVMLQNNHQHGMLWITTFSWPSGRIQAADSVYQQTSQQSSWLTQAYRQLRAQLYIGAAFFNALNPAEKDHAASLIMLDGSYHPFFNTLGKLIAQNNQSLDAAYGFDEPQDKRITKTRF